MTSHTAGASDQDRQTIRRRILLAARTLLLEEGYGAFTQGTLAARAAVDEATVHEIVGDRRSVLKTCYDFTLAGDDSPISIRERPQFKALFAATESIVFLNAYALWMRLTYDRIGPIMSAILVTEVPDSDSAAFLATIEDERRRGTGVAVERMREMQWLRRGMTPDEAIDSIWSLASPDIYHRLVVTRGWSTKDYEEWLAVQFRAAILHR